MSRLEELLQTLCPDGVEFRKLGQLCNITTGKLNANAMTEGGKYPFFTCAKEVYQIDKFAFDTEALLVSGNGSQVGHIHYYKGKFNAYQRTYVLDSFSQNISFISHVLRAFLKQRILEEVNVSGVPYIKLETLSDFLIPVPPLPVQEEIVRILDTFSGVVTELEQKLNAEQAARVRQYEHYRNELLSFDSNSKIMQNLLAVFCPNGVEYNDLGEIVEILDSQRKPVTKSDRRPGPYPYYGANGIQDYVAGYIFDGTYLLLGEDGSVINPDGSPILIWATGKIWVNNHAHILAEKNNVALLRYLYYYLQTVDVSKVVRGLPPKINQENLRKIRVALPPIEAQKQIVSILDRFNTLVNDLKSGLPAEIALRRKQYEYYRDKLLTFPQKPGGVS